MDRKISVAIPYYNNSKFIQKTLETLIDDERVDEIIIVDDKSQDIDDLNSIIYKLNTTKVKLFENKINMGCYHNKIISVSKCSNDWCILLDSDNYIDKVYLDRVYNISKWDKNTIYAPDRPITFPGTPSKVMDYRIYSNTYITNELFISDFNKNVFQCLINTCNYFIPCKEYVSCMKKGFDTYNRDIIDCLDSAVLFTDWLLCKNRILIVDNLSYYHRLHPNSNYVNGHSRKYETMVKHKLYNSIKNI